MTSHTFNDSISFLNSSSYNLAMIVGDTFSYKTRETHFLNEETDNNANKFNYHNISPYLQTSFNNFVIDISDDHSMDDSDSK